jgi:hypothetical protein
MAFEYPNGYQDIDGILRYAKDVGQANLTFWNAIERQAQENILMFIGGQLQWWTYSSNIRAWRPLGLSKDTPPRPVTNRIKPLINDLASKLVGFKPPLTWSPGSNQDADYVAASVADRVNLAIEKETRVADLKPLAARWLATTGNVFVVSMYDNSPETGTRFIQARRCLGCGQVAMPKDIEEVGGLCPYCQSSEVSVQPDTMTGQPTPTTVTRPRFEMAVGPGQIGSDVFGPGQPMGIAYPRGRHSVELENVFTVRFDPQAERFHKSPYVRIARTRDRAWISERYGEEFAENVTYSRYNDNLAVLYDSLAFSAFGSGGLSGVTEASGQRALVERLWIRPHPEKAPGGIYAEIVGDKIAPIAFDDAGQPVASGIPYPYHDERGEPMLNVAHIEFDQVPGRALASTRCDDVTPLQRELNELDFYIKNHHRAMSNAVWLIPHGSDPKRISGDPGGVYIRYNPLATGHKPERAQGVMVAADIYQYRAIRKAEIDEVFGSYEVSRGEAPRGVSAYAALQLLDERASQGQSNAFANWATGWAEVSRQGINIWREYADEERTLSLGIGRWATKTFNKSQMIGGVDIDVDVGQGWPMTMVAKTARIAQGTQMGFINPFDPQQRFLGLRALRIPELMPDYNRDYERAGRVLDQMIQAPDPGQLPPAPYPFDNHAIHLNVLTNYIKDEEFESLEPWRQQAIVLRAQLHYQAMREDILNQMAGAGQNPPRIGGAGPGGGGGGGKNGGPPTDEESVLDEERQDASPDMMSGVTAGNA